MEPITEEELEVAEILTLLPVLIPKYNRIVTGSDPFVWSATKRRTLSGVPRRCYLVVPEPTQALRPVSSVGSPCVDPPKETVKEEPAKGTRSSPRSPLCFSPSGGEDTDHKPNARVASSVSYRPYKKAKVRNKEWIQQQNHHISILCETNKNLRQEAAEIEKRYETLMSENARLKELKSKWEMAQKGMMGQQQQRENNSVTPPGPTGSHSAHIQQDPSTNPEVPLEATAKIEQKQHPQAAEDGVRFQLGVAAPQFWSLGGGQCCKAGAPTGLPDLNAQIGENGYVMGDPNPSGRRQQPKQVVVVMEPKRQSWPLDAKKLATAEARRKRIEINRRKFANSADVALRKVGGARVGIGR